MIQLRLFHLSFSEHLKKLDLKRCVTCKMCFKAPEIEAHKLTHKAHFPRECKVCDIYLTEEDFKAHNNNLEKLHRVCCPLCSERFKFKHQLVTHIKVHEVLVGKRYQYPCNLCTKKYNYLKDIIFHKEWHLKKKNAPPRKFKCPTCVAKFDTKEELERHDVEMHKENATDEEKGETGEEKGETAEDEDVVGECYCRIVNDLQKHFTLIHIKTK